MTNKIIPCSNISLHGQQVFFDTNIWMFINGGGPNAFPHKVKTYSDAYKVLLQQKNRIFINDYVIAEFYNRSIKFAYEIRCQECEEQNIQPPKLKEFRRSAAFDYEMSSIEDTCLNMLDDCEFVAVSGKHYDIASVVRECSEQRIDFSDKIIIEFCKKENLYLVTDDADYAGCGLAIITANKKLRRNIEE